MKTKKYKMANCVIEVTSIYDKVHNYCQDYETEEPADFSIEITPGDIAFEKQKANSEYAYEGLPLPNFSDELLEETAVYRKIGEKMPDYDTVIFHGSAIAVDGQGYLFTAKSGTGKSTHTKLWRKLLSEKATMINDDKPLIHIGETVTIYGTPYNGKHRLGNNIAVPLKAICILKRSTKNHIKKISKMDAYAMLLQQVYRPQDIKQMKKTINLIDKMTEKIKFYQLECNMDISAAELSYKTMKG